ncbi:hypothetical protein, partial [Halorubrum sp. ASP121]|uniref:hypothetical protein n=1 Tax=Halorubrum sp. ASP121 TaxID=1855858 RepID=UPI001A7E061B
VNREAARPTGGRPRRERAVNRVNREAARIERSEILEEAERGGVTGERPHSSEPASPGTPRPRYTVPGSKRAFNAL